MAQVCDLVHESVPSAEIILCSIIPRQADRRPQDSGSRMLSRYQKWIDAANRLMLDFAMTTHYVRVLTYGNYNKV